MLTYSRLFFLLAVGANATLVACSSGSAVAPAAAPTSMPTATSKPTPTATPSAQPTFSPGPTPTVTPTFQPTATANIYVTNDRSATLPGTAEVDYWRVGSNGNVAPIGAIAGSNTGLFYGTQGIVVTASEIYVAEEYTDAILGFPLNSSGNVAPNVIIAGSQTNIHSPIGLALDSDDNLYVANCGGCDGTQSSPYAVEEFAAGSTGNVAPLRAIVGPDTQIHYPAGLAVAANGDLYVGDAEQANEMNPGKIVVFSSTANGDAAPERSIAGSNTELYDSAGIAVTPQSLFVESYPYGPGAPVILRFNLQANGNVAPLASIEGPNTGLNPYLEGLASGLQGSSIYGVDPGTLLGGSPRPAILQFASNASGNALPLTSITGPNTRLFIPLFGYVR